MPMGIVSDSEFESQLQNTGAIPKSIPEPMPESMPEPSITDITDANPNPEIVEAEVITGEVIGMKSRGRNIGEVNVPESLRKLIAGTAHIEGRPAALEFAREMGVSPSSVSAYTKGATSTTTYHNPDESIINFVKARKSRVTKKALRVMTAALGHITDKKLMSADAKELSGVAKDMSAIVGHFSDPASVTNNNNGPTFVLYSPTVMQEDSFKAIPSHD